MSIIRIAATANAATANAATRTTVKPVINKVEFF
jgi:hypothetical protein